MADFGNGFLNTNIIPRSRTSPAQTYASGKWAIAVCDRCGWKYPWKSLRTEPGTFLKVCQTCDDGMYSRVTHPQNFIATNTQDAIALRWARPDQAPNYGGSGYPAQYATPKTNPWYLSTEDGYLIEWDQFFILEALEGQVSVRGFTPFEDNTYFTVLDFSDEDNSGFIPLLMDDE